MGRTQNSFAKTHQGAPALDTHGCGLQLLATHLLQHILLRLSRNKDVLGDDHQEANASMDPVVVLNLQLSFRG